MVERLTDPSEVPSEMRGTINTFEDARKKLTEDIQFAVGQSTVVYGPELGRRIAMFTAALVLVDEAVKMLKVLREVHPEDYENMLLGTKGRFEQNLGWKIE